MERAGAAASAFFVSCSMRNLMLTYFDGYTDPKVIEPFVDSFLRVTHRDESHLFVLHHEGSENPVVQYLNERKVENQRVPHLTGNPYVDRFEIYAQATQSWSPTGRVMACDITDVVFQYDPFIYMDEAFKIRNTSKFVVASEDIDFREMQRGDWMKLAFPVSSKGMRKRNVYNVGVIGGRVSIFAQICSRLSQMANKAPYKDENGAVIKPHSAAFSILMANSSICLATLPVNNNTNFIGTIGPAIWNTPRLILKDGQLCNQYGQPYAVVHQYDHLEGLIWKGGGFVLQGFEDEHYLEVDLNRAGLDSASIRYYH